MNEPKRLLIQNADWIITMDEAGNRFHGGDLYIVGNKIAGVGKHLSLGETPADEVIDARGCLVIPGMINTHHHCAHTIVRNLPHAFESSLMQTLEMIYDRLAYFTEESIYAAALGALGDLLKTGCTTSCDQHYAFPKGNPHMVDMEILAAKELGIRFHALRGSLSMGAEGGCTHVPPSLVERIDSILSDTVRLIETYHNPAYGSMIRVGISPCWMVYEDQDVVRESRKIARQYRVSLHSHLADSREEFAFCAERHGCTPVEYAEKMGYLQPGNFFAHCVQMTRNDFALLAKNKVGVACCCNSDMILNSGVAKTAEFMRRGIQFGIGVDGASSNNTSNMIAEMKNAYLIQRFTDKETIITPEKILYMATVGGAKTLGRDDIGYLAPGMIADFVILDWNQFQYAGGKCDPVSAIVLGGDARMVDKVFVDGRMVVEHGQLTQIDEAKTADFINQQTQQLINRYKVTK